jgi:hypothetical protein
MSSCGPLPTIALIERYPPTVAKLTEESALRDIDF